jgi:hypothetical protein
MDNSLQKSLAISACVISIAALYIILSGVDPTVPRMKRHYPPLLWGYDPSETSCNDSTDNDGDGDIDCEDADCSADPSCT